MEQRSESSCFVKAKTQEVAYPNGPKLSNLDGSQFFPGRRIEVAEKRCVAGSVVFENCMEGNGIRFLRPDPFLPQSSAFQRPQSGSYLNRPHR